MQMIPIDMQDNVLETEYHIPRKSSIWDLNGNHRCAVIGTCLTMVQLKKAINRFSKFCAQQGLETDYAIHSYIVSVCETRNAISQHINKLLNSEHTRFINHCRTIKTEDQMLQVWRAIDKDDVCSLSGYLWAILSSKFSTEEVKNTVYGDVHTLSYIAGKGHKAAYSKLLEEKSRLVSDLKHKGLEVEKKIKKIASQRVEIQLLKQRLKKSASQAAGPSREEPRENPDFDKYRSKIAQQKQVIARLTQKLHDIPQQSEQIKVDTLAVDPIQQDQSCEGDCKACTNNDLCGKKILYVGGYSRHRKKFKQLTESINGQFFYHDGGMQQSEHRLDELVKKVDAVFCPVDCISHNAMGRIRNLTRSQCKDCVFLRSASLSSFRNEISRYAS